MTKGFAGVTIIIMAFLVIFVLLFIVGIAGNWTPIQGDVLGVISFFTAITTTVNEFITITNLLVWSMIFMVVQGLFLFAYYQIGRFLYVRIPEFQRWFDKTKRLLSR